MCDASLELFNIEKFFPRFKLHDYRRLPCIVDLAILGHLLLNGCDFGTFKFLEVLGNSSKCTFKLFEVFLSYLVFSLLPCIPWTTLIRLYWRLALGLTITFVVLIFYSASSTLLPLLSLVTLRRVGSAKDELLSRSDCLRVISLAFSLMAFDF